MTGAQLRLLRVPAVLHLGAHRLQEALVRLLRVCVQGAENGLGVSVGTGPSAWTGAREDGLCDERGSLR